MGLDIARSLLYGIAVIERGTAGQPRCVLTFISHLSPIPMITICSGRLGVLDIPEYDWCDLREEVRTQERLLFILSIHAEFAARSINCHTLGDTRQRSRYIPTFSSCWPLARLRRRWFSSIYPPKNYSTQTTGQHACNALRVSAIFPAAARRPLF